MSAKSLILFGIALSIIAIKCLAFQRVVLYEEPIRAKCLCGQIQLPESSEPAEGVLVEQCSPDWKRVYASTYTDSDGAFQLPKSHLKKMNYLRISRSLFRTICLKVKVSADEKERLLINLQFD